MGGCLTILLGVKTRPALSSLMLTRTQCQVTAAAAAEAYEVIMVYFREKKGYELARPASLGPVYFIAHGCGQVCSGQSKCLAIAGTGVQYHRGFRFETSPRTSRDTWDSHVLPGRAMVGCNLSVSMFNFVQYS